MFSVNSIFSKRNIASLHWYRNVLVTAIERQTRHVLHLWACACVRFFAAVLYAYNIFLKQDGGLFVITGDRELQISIWIKRCNSFLRSILHGYTDHHINYSEFVVTLYSGSQRLWIKIVSELQTENDIRNRCVINFALFVHFSSCLLADNI